MAIVLSILKIIGIVLLVLVCVILCLLIFLLVMPIRYRLKATYIENDVNAVGTVTYLWPIVRARASFTKADGFQTKIKVLWISLFEGKDNDTSTKQKKPKKNKKQKTDKKKNVKNDLKNQASKKEADIKRDSNEAELSNESKDVSNNKTELASNNTSDKTSDNTLDIITNHSTPKKSSHNETFNDSEEQKESKSKNIKTKLLGLWEKLKRKYQQICSKIKRLYQSFEKTKDKAKWYKKLYDTDTTKDAINYIKKQLGWTLKMYRPRKLKGYLYFGFADPALTGEALGALAMSYPWLGKHLQIIPNFEEACFEEDIYISGYIQLYVIVFAAIKLYFNKKVKVTWKRFNKIKGGN